MTKEPSGFQAPRLAGGNDYDDLRLNISAAHEAINAQLTSQVARPKLGRLIFNWPRILITSFSLLIGFRHFSTFYGTNSSWFREFESYWTRELEGRPLWGRLHFVILAHEYRKRAQHVHELNWHNPTEHITNWQQPSEIYLTFHYCQKIAAKPALKPFLLGFMPRKGRVLEYGCSLAPFYDASRSFFSHRNYRWTLADIPNFPFHFAKWRYRNDANVSFIDITEDNFSNPLEGRGKFDAVIATTVLEHVDDPTQVAKNLLDSLEDGGLLIFDFIKSDAKGLDTPKGLALRSKALDHIIERTELVRGDLSNLNETISMTAVRKLR